MELNSTPCRRWFLPRWSGTRPELLVNHVFDNLAMPAPADIESPKRMFTLYVLIRPFQELDHGLFELSVSLRRIQRFVWRDESRTSKYHRPELLGKIESKASGTL